MTILIAARAAPADADEGDADALARQSAIDVVLHDSALAEAQPVEMAARRKRGATHPCCPLQKLATID